MLKIGQKTRSLISLFIIIGIIAAALFLMFFFGLFPVANINGKPVLFREYSRLNRGLLTYNENTNQQIPAEFMEEGVLFSLVEDRIVESALDKRGISGGSIAEAVQKNLNRIPKERLEEHSRLYGWSADQFSSIILVPQARIDILNGVLNTNGEKYEDWLSEEFNKAKVSIYFLPWAWNSGKLEKR